MERNEKRRKDCKSRKNFRIISIADSTLSRRSPGTFGTIEKRKVKTFGYFSGFSRDNLKIFRHKNKPAFSFFRLVHKSEEFCMVGRGGVS